MNLLSEDKLGAASIENVKLSDAKELALRMQEKGIAFNTISTVSYTHLDVYKRQIVYNSAFQQLLKNRLHQ